MITNEDKDLLFTIASFHELPVGAYNIRKDGKSVARNSSANILVETNSENNGLLISIKDNTINESVHIPVIISESGIKEVVYNDFKIGKNCDVTIIAGCGIHNSGKNLSEHSGIHRFIIGEGSKVKYIEKHYGEGSNPDRIMNPTTEITIGDNAEFNMETVQIGGIKSTIRKTSSKLAEKSKLEISEKIMTEFDQIAETNFVADLNGENCSCNIISRSVAKNNSKQHFNAVMNGNNSCFGHTECDAIVMDSAQVLAKPAVNANNSNASLVHEAAIGKIAGEQIIKLMTLGLTETDAEKLIIKGFLK